jgi:GMP synthase PP-ATPase subunit
MTKSPVTRMLLMIFRSSLEAEVFELLRKLRVKAFSDVPRVLGVGEAGIALHSFPSPGFNCMILTALDERESERVIDGVRRFHDRIRKAQKNSAVPLRLFVLPCTQAI